MKETQEPVKIFIADFKNKVVREKAIMGEPEKHPADYDDGSVLYNVCFNAWDRYHDYISSLKQYPATWLTPEMDGREMIKYVDFEVDPYFNNAYPLKTVATTQEPVGGMPLFHNEDANVYIDRAIAMIKEEYEDNPFTAGYNGIVSLLGYAKESHIASITPPHAPVGIDVKQAAANWQKENEKYMPDEQSESMLYDSFMAGVEWKSASLPSSGVTGDEWISLKEYEQKALQLLADKPVIKMLVQNGLPFEKWGDNINNLIDKELGATRELRVKMLSSVTGESEVIVGCQHPFKEVRQQGLNFFCDKCKEWF